MIILCSVVWLLEEAMQVYSHLVTYTYVNWIAHIYIYISWKSDIYINPSQWSQIYLYLKSIPSGHIKCLLIDG